MGPAVSGGGVLVVLDELDELDDVVLVELKGGNDGLNTVVPVGDPAYARLRPKLAIARDDVIRLSDRAALHPALAPLLRQGCHSGHHRKNRHGRRNRVRD